MLACLRRVWPQTPLPAKRAATAKAFFILGQEGTTQQWNMATRGLSFLFTLRPCLSKSGHQNINTASPRAAPALCKPLFCTCPVRSFPTASTLQRRHFSRRNSRRDSRQQRHVSTLPPPLRLTTLPPHPTAPITLVRHVHRTGSLRAPCDSRPFFSFSALPAATSSSRPNCAYQALPLTFPRSTSPRQSPPKMDSDAMSDSVYEMDNDSDDYAPAPVCLAQPQPCD